MGGLRQTPEAGACPAPNSSFLMGLLSPLPLGQVYLLWEKSSAMQSL